MSLQPDWGLELEEVREVLALTEQAREAAGRARDALSRELRRSGFTVRETGAMLGISPQRVSQIDRADWGHAPTYTPAELLATAREAFHAAKYAQKLREERYAMGYRTETRAYYRDPSVAQADESEDRITWSGFHVGREAEKAANA